MDPEEISRRAEKERQKLESQDKPVSQERAGKTHDAFSFYTYCKIFPGGFNLVVWMLLCVPGMVLLGLYFFSDDTGAWAMYAGAACIGMFILRWCIDFLQKIFTYSSYKNFTASLGFPLEGWNTLGAYPKQLNEGEWSKKSTVEVVMKGNGTAAQPKLIKDALYLFNTRANKKFYEAAAGRDGRTSWDFVHALKVTGSSDKQVTGEMYTLINVYLKSIQEKYHTIASVKVNFDPEIFKVEPPPNTD
jgi:hypothetical protein